MTRNEKSCFSEFQFIVLILCDDRSVANTRALFSIQIRMPKKKSDASEFLSREKENDAFRETDVSVEGLLKKVMATWAGC